MVQKGEGVVWPLIITEWAGRTENVKYAKIGGKSGPQHNYPVQ